MEKKMEDIEMIEDEDGLEWFMLRAFIKAHNLHETQIFAKIETVEGNSLMRILNIAAFALLGYSCTEGRNCKPFNPLLGETYEAAYPDNGLRFISEKDKFVSGTKVELGFLFHRYTLFRSLTSVTQSSILKRFLHPLWLRFMAFNGCFYHKYLDHNQFTGRIPDAFYKHTFLKEMYIEGNAFRPGVNPIGIHNVQHYVKWSGCHRISTGYSGIL